MARYFVQALEKGLIVLQTFNRQAGPLTLSQVARASGMGLPTASRYLRTLTDLGFMGFDPETKKYALTPKVLNLGFSALNGLDLRQRLLPLMTELHRRFKVNVNLAVFVDRRITIIERLTDTGPGNLNLTVGSTLPAYCTSMGRCFLAHLPPPELAAYFQAVDLVKLTSRTLTEPRDLEKTLEEIRTRGWAETSGEISLGWANLAVPLWNRHQVEAALGVALSADRYGSGPELDELRTALVAAGHRATV